MKRLSLRLCIALLTFIVGVTIVTFWYLRSNARLASDRPALSRTKEEENIAEAVFRYKFEDSSDGRKFSVYFLWLGDERDPNGDFMERFTGHDPPVKGVSQSVKVSDGVKDKETGELGVIYGIPHIQWLNDSEIDVSVSKFVWGWGQYGYVCRVVRDNNRWMVQGCKLTSAT